MRKKHNLIWSKLEKKIIYLSKEKHKKKNFISI